MGIKPVIREHTMTISEFFNMGGYAFYVWTSYGLTFVVLLANIIIPIEQRRQLLHSLSLKQKRSQE